MQMGKQLNRREMILPAHKDYFLTTNCHLVFYTMYSTIRDTKQFKLSDFVKITSQKQHIAQTCIRVCPHLQMCIQTQNILLHIL